MQIIAESITYTYPSGKNILHEIDFSLPKGEKAALVGNNGSGKSTFLRIISGHLKPNSGSVQIDKHHWVIPQHTGQFNALTVAQVLNIEDKINALHEIENGSVDPLHFEILAGDWEIHERLAQALGNWGLAEISPNTPFKGLSGGEKTRVFLAGITIHEPDLVLMDEPTNHLDNSARSQLYEMLEHSKRDFLIVSHDRELLSKCNPVYELSSLGIKKYGGNFNFYEEQKKIEIEALEQRIRHAGQSIDVARKSHHETMQRKQKLDARGYKKAKKAGLPKIVMNAARNRAEGSTSKLNDVHEQKIAAEKRQLRELREKQRKLKNIKINLNHSPVHSGKILYKADKINFSWPGANLLWGHSLDFIIKSGEHIRITGNNRSGKSTLIRLLTGDLEPTMGNIDIQSENRFLLDQEYNLIDRDATVLEQAVKSNSVKLQDHQLRTLLHRYLFEEDMWEQSRKSLSGGELMRLSLCCLSLQTNQPDTIILDEPTNNLDLRNLSILTEAISEYEGTLIIVSHDRQFVKDVGIDRSISLYIPSQ